MASLMFVGLAVPTSSLALNGPRYSFAGVSIVETAMVGLTLLAAGPSGVRVLLSVVGGLLLTDVHIINWHRHSTCGLPTGKANGG